MRARWQQVWAWLEGEPGPVQTAVTVLAVIAGLVGLWWLRALR